MKNNNDTTMAISEEFLDSIIPYEFNNRKHSELQVNRIANSIAEFGFNQPIVIDEANIVLVGHGRLLAARKLGLTKAPTYQILGLSEVKKKAYRILDNKLQNDSTWDFNNLELELGFLEDNGLDFETWGLEDLRKLFPISEPETLEDDEPNNELSSEAYIKRGDIIELGRHRVMCGDSTSEKDVAELMDEQQSELLFTSPPYEDMRTYDSDKLNLNTAHLAQVIPIWSVASEFLAVNLGIRVKEGEVTPYWNDYLVAAKDLGLKLLAWNVWDKGCFLGIAAGTAMFGLQHDWIFVFGSDRRRLRRFVPNKKPSLGKSKSITLREADGSMKRQQVLQHEAHQLGSVHQVQANKSDNKVSGHPATFPIELPALYIKSFSVDGDIITDCFLGSGTTLIAAEQLSRICYGMEQSPTYCQSIIMRYQRYCAKNNKEFTCKINGETFEPIDEANN